MDLAQAMRVIDDVIDYARDIVHRTVQIDAAGRKELTAPLRSIARPMPSGVVAECVWSLLAQLGYTVSRIKVTGGSYDTPEDRVQLTWE